MSKPLTARLNFVPEGDNLVLYCEIKRGDGLCPSQNGIRRKTGSALSPAMWCAEANPAATTTPSKSNTPEPTRNRNSLDPIKLVSFVTNYCALGVFTCAVSGVKARLSKKIRPAFFGTGRVS
jgi:hypothetical protein